MREHERVAVIDLGPGDEHARQKLAAAAVAAGLAPVMGDGVEDALAGVDVDRDALQLAAALEQAKHAFGDLDCTAATEAATTAVGIAAARHAAHLPAVDEARAWAYILLCADTKSHDTDAALTAASRLRALGGSSDVDPALLAKYPEVDALANREMIEIDVKADTDGAAIWIDDHEAGASPLHVALPAGHHVIAAAAGTRRGYVTGTAVKTQPVITVALTDQAGAWSGLAARIAGWHGKMPSATELAQVLAQVHARVALVRHGDTVEAWGRAGLAEPPRHLGGEDGTRTLAEADKLVALVVDRVQGWTDHAPDPDVPLLVESLDARAKAATAQPTKWWVYATIAGAVLAGAIVIYAHDTASDTQRVELHYP